MVDSQVRPNDVTNLKVQEALETVERPDPVDAETPEAYLMSSDKRGQIEAVMDALVQVFLGNAVLALLPDLLIVVVLALEPVEEQRHFGVQISGLGRKRQEQRRCPRE